MIIDIHSHIKRNYENPQIPEEELLADMDKNKISRRVVSALEGRSVREQNDYIVDLVSKHMDKLTGCAMINPKEYDSIEET